MTKPTRKATKTVRTTATLPPGHPGVPTLLDAAPLRPKFARSGRPNKTYAMEAVTGFMALFGLNKAAFRAPAELAKNLLDPGQPLMLNGEVLMTARSPELRSTPGLSPQPTTLPFGAEASGASDAERIQANEAARAEVLKEFPDVDVLRAFSGGGGLGESVDQFFTPRAIGQLLWSAVETLVPPHKAKGKNPAPARRVLEPSCGNGAVLALAPAGFELTGVEIDPVAARAAQVLLPHAHIHAMPFESFTTRSTDALFDAAVGNIPFAARPFTQDLHQPLESRAERYFVRETLRRVRHVTGVLALVVPMSLMTGRTHSRWRLDILRMGLPLHAAIVPTGAFRKTGAHVTTVVLVIRRHDLGVEEALKDLGDPTTVLSKYCQDVWHKRFVQAFLDGESLTTPVKKDQGPELTESPSSEGGLRGDKAYELTFPVSAFVLSDQRKVTVGHYGNPVLEGALKITSSFIGQLATAARAEPVLLKGLIETIRAEHGERTAQDAEEAARGEGLFPIAEGTLSRCRKYAFRLGEWVVTDDFASPEIAMATEVAQALDAYLAAVQGRRPDVERRRENALRLDARYASAVGAYPRARLARLSGRFPLLGLLLAHLDVHGRVSIPELVPFELDITPGSVGEVALQLADLMALTEGNLAKYARVSEGEAVAHLVEHYCFNGELWVEPGLYYAGMAYRKAEHARMQASQHSGHRAAALRRQADVFVSKVKRLSLADLNLSPRDSVIPEAALQSWVNDFLGSVQPAQGDVPARELLLVKRENGAVKFRVRASAGNDVVMARGSFDQQAAYHLERYLNHRTVVDAVATKDRTREEVRAERAVAIDEARAYEDKVSAHFRNWLSSSTFVQAIEDAYMHARGSLLTAQGSDRPLGLKDWHGPLEHPYQSADVRAMASVTGLINNLEVGLGKTYECLLLVAYLKRCGQAQRPIISVPAGLVSNWATHARLALPGWKIVTVGMSPRRDRLGNTVFKTKRDGSVMVDSAGRPIEAWVEDSPAVKREKIAGLSAGRADLVIMSRESLTSIGLRRETRQALIMSDPQYLRNLETQDEYDGNRRRGRHQQLVRQQSVFGSMMSRVQVADDGDLAFELLGCDFLAHDEGHSLKNLFAAPDVFGETPKFLGGGGESNRALDALHKGRVIRGNGGRTYLFTASWIKNSPIEAYSMMSQVTDSLGQYGLDTMEALMEQYIRIEPQIITGMDGSVDVKPCVVGFWRLLEFKSVISGHVLTRTYGDPGVVRRDGTPLTVPEAVPEEVMIDMTPEMSAQYAELRKRAREADPTKAGPDHPFSVLWEMRKLTVDPALKGVPGLNPRFEKIAQLVTENRSLGGKALVFLSIGEREGAFERLKRAIIDAGYPEAEIALVSAGTHKSSVQRQDLEDDYNYGDLTLIIGTDVLGQGFNLQVGTSMVVNADMPWNFEELRQRTGRGARQGNVFEKLRNVYLLMRGSFDTITYTIMSGKKSWLSQLWLNVDELENTGAGFNGEEMALLMSDDPDKTREQIRTKREELEQMTGRAALRRNLEVLVRAHYARERLDKLRSEASARKYGWTAHDHARVNGARKILEARRRELALIPDFPFAKLLDYTLPIFWLGTLPVHQGMEFTHAGVPVTVVSVEAGASVLVRHENGATAVLSAREVANATKFGVSQDPAHYREAGHSDQPTVSFAQDVRIHVLDGRQVNPVPKSREGVVSVDVRRGVVETLREDASPWEYTAAVTLGALMHFVVQVEDEHITVTQVAVLASNPDTLQSSLAVKDDPRFTARLLAIAAQALGAEAIREKPQKRKKNVAA